MLVVDLDGTLTRTDTLFESALLLGRKRLVDLFLLPFWLLKGKAYLKFRITEKVIPDPAHLPYVETFLEWLRAEKSNGRKLALCTASNRETANAIADHVGLFDDVIASDKDVNMAGSIKRAELDHRYGADNYDYAGNSHEDMVVWDGARKAIVVNASPGVVKRARAQFDVETVFEPEKRSISTWIQVFRINQWLKNVLLFVPLVAAHQLSQPGLLLTLLVAFISFSISASAIYILNDLFDIESDRLHPRKRDRPFASAAVPIPWGVALIVVCLFAGISLAVFVGHAFLYWLILYLVLTTSYTFWLKQQVLVDSLTLAGLYTLRIVAGAAAVSVALSFWLLAFSIFIFLSLAFIKRYTELQTQISEGNTVAHGRGYHVDDISMIQTFGIASGYTSILVLALYLNSDTVLTLYQAPQFIWAAVPAMLFWISWIWLKAHRGKMHDDPIVFAVKDKASMLVGILIVLSFLLATLWKTQ